MPLGQLYLFLSFLIFKEGESPHRGRLWVAEPRQGAQGTGPCSVFSCLGSTLPIKKWCVGELSFPLNFKSKSERGIVAADKVTMKRRQFQKQWQLFVWLTSHLKKATQRKFFSFSWHCLITEQKEQQR